MRRKRAVVIGAGIGGLLAAQALTAAFDEVTIVERDVLPTEAGARKGTPQARHGHALLKRGGEVFEILLPGITREVLACGAATVRIGETAGWLGPYGWSPPFSPAIDVLACSRDLLESAVRDRIRSGGRVSILDGHDALGLVGDRRRVTGLRIASRGESREERTLDAELVVDASGRGSPLRKWLEAMGCVIPEEQRIDAKVVYGSAIVELARPLPCGWNLLFVVAAPPETLRGGAIFPIENGRSMVTLVGMGGDRPPTEEAAWKEWIAGRRTATLHDALRDARLITPIASSRSTESRFLAYHRAPLPGGVLAIADSVVTFNPVYGQGMTVAAIEALALREELRGGEGFEARARARIATIAGEAFRLAASADLRVPGVEGTTPTRLDRTLARYTDGVFDACTDHPDLARTVTGVMHMLQPATALFAPRVVRHALPRAIRGVAIRSPALSPAWRARAGL